MTKLSRLYRYTDPNQAIVGTMNQLCKVLEIRRGNLTYYLERAVNRSGITLKPINDYNKIYKVYSMHDGRTRMLTWNQMNTITKHVPAHPLVMGQKGINILEIIDAPVFFWKMGTDGRYHFERQEYID